MGFRTDVPDLRGTVELFREWRAGRVAEEELEGEAKVLALADRIRLRGGGSPSRLYACAVEEFRAGRLEFDRVTTVYRHAMIHAGWIVPRDRPRFHQCPTCEAPLEVRGG